MKEVIVAYHLLVHRGYPVVLGDLPLYCRMEKKEILTVIAKNRNSFAWACTSLEYVRNVARRLRESLREKTGPLPEIGSKESIVEQLHARGYFFHRDPLLPCACVLLNGLCAKSVVQYVAEAVPHAKLTVSAVDQERKRIEAVLDPSKKQDPATPRALKKAKAKKEKEEKIRRAVAMYAQEITDRTQYSTDYESILIENLLKQGISPETIRNLTKKGMEYYAEFGD